MPPNILLPRHPLADKELAREVVVVEAPAVLLY